MRWTKENDLALVKEILLYEPFICKKGSPERGPCWERVSESLNSMDGFKTSQRSVRDRFNLIRTNREKKSKEELQASGISPEESELDGAIEDLSERFKEADEMQRQETSEKREKAAGETAKAVEMRKRSLETFSETKSRNDETPKRPRNNGTDTISYLSQRYETEVELRKQELRLRKEENEAAQARNEIMMNQQRDFFATLLHTQQQQQAALLLLMEKIMDKNM